jgi:hypothetical protein
MLCTCSCKCQKRAHRASAAISGLAFADRIYRGAQAEERSLASISASVIVPYCFGSRFPNMLWLMPCSIRIFFIPIPFLEPGVDNGDSNPLPLMT